MSQDWLGYAPGVRRLWESTEQKGMDEQILFDVPVGTEESDGPGGHPSFGSEV